MTLARLRARIPGPWLAVGAITAVGALIRAIPVVAGGFPLNDGGLFAEMIAAVRAESFALPQHVGYNGISIPFAYPPLGLYLSAALAGSESSVLEVLRYLPAVVSVLAIPVAYSIFRQLLPGEAWAFVAAAAFAVMPRSYNWAIAGGGVTRSFGMLFALVAISASIRMYRTRTLRWPAAAGIGLGLCALSHPQAAVFGTASVALMLAARTIGWRRSFLHLLIAGAIAAVIVIPWFGTVVSRHGWATLLGAAQTGGNLYESVLLLFTFRFSDGLVEALGLVGAFGLFVCVINRKWIWPAWTAAAFLLGSRAGLTYATVPVAGAISWAVADALRLLRIPPPVAVRDLFRLRRGAVFVIVLMAVAFVDSVASAYDPRSPLQALSSAERQAMRWVAESTPADARFLVVSGEPWELDAIAEWFPTLTQRRSVATVQGSEWLGPGKFREHERRHYWLLHCVAFTDKNCAAEWDRVIEPVDFVIVASGDAAAAEGHPCCLQLADRIVAAGGQLVLSIGDVRIVRMRGADEVDLRESST